MLVKALSRQNIDPGTVEAAEKAAQQALDSLWKERWINDSVTRRDERLLADLAGWAEDIRSRADLVIVVAGEEREAINGVLRAVPGSAGSPEVIVWDGSMSSGDFAGLIEKIDARSTVMIAVSGGSEPLEQRTAYAVIKQAIFAAHHDEEGDKIYAVCPRGMGVIAMDAEENVYPMTEWPAGSGWMPANTAAVLLPLMIKGADCAAFLKGFYDTVGSPEWDAGAPVPAYVIAGALSGGGSVEVFSWQRETRGLARRFAGTAEGRMIDMPSGRGISAVHGAGSDAGLRILIASDAGHQDIMTPPFEGCDPDGSLELLVKSEADREFFGSAEDDGIPGFKFCTEELDARSAGALTAYLEMTLWLARWFRA